MQNTPALTQVSHSIAEAFIALTSARSGHVELVARSLQVVRDEKVEYDRDDPSEPDEYVQFASKKSAAGLIAWLVTDPEANGLGKQGDLFGIREMAHVTWKKNPPRKVSISIGASSRTLLVPWNTKVGDVIVQLTSLPDVMLVCRKKYQVDQTVLQW